MASCMVLDDSSVIRKVARRIIEDAGYSVMDASDGHEALQMCREQIPDMIIIDWMMPNMSGLEFIQSFKAAFGDRGNNTALVYCTHELDLSAMTKAKRAGATHFIMKPFDRKGIHKKLLEIGISSVHQAA